MITVRDVVTDDGDVPVFRLSMQEKKILLCSREQVDHGMERKKR